MRLNDKRFITVILILAAIGILYRLITHPSGMLVPVFVLGTVYLLYKFPPSRWRGRGANRRFISSRPPAPDSNGKTRSRSKAKFRVIPGYKKDDPPRR